MAKDRRPGHRLQSRPDRIHRAPQENILSMICLDKGGTHIFDSAMKIDQLAGSDRVIIQVAVPDTRGLVGRGSIHEREALMTGKSYDKWPLFPEIITNSRMYNRQDVSPLAHADPQLAGSEIPLDPSAKLLCQRANQKYR